MGVRIVTEEDLRQYLRQNLTKDECWNIVSQANGYSGEFPDYDFFDAEEFYNIFCVEGKKVAEVINAMRNGTNLDEGSSPADPFADYLSWGAYGDSIDSTDDPAGVIYDDILDDIIDYIVDKAEEPDFDFPEHVQKMIEEYLAYSDEEGE